MSQPQNRSIAKPLPGALARPDWRPGEELTASELGLEQRYFVQRLRRHLRLAHGWGVVCGLKVAPAGGWDLYVCPGYGIGPCGDEIFVERPFRFSLRDYLWTQPAGQPAGRAWIAIEASADPVAYEPAPAIECDCGCGDDPEKTSRMADGFRMVVFWTPPTVSRGQFDICSGTTPPCPPCPEVCALPLASIALPRADQAIFNPAIANVEDR
jgi:hypothetical protein